MLKENIIYTHWKSVHNAPEWRWPNFAPRELASKGEGELMVNFDALDKLEKLRSMTGPIVLTSAYRSVKHNKKQGGAVNSMHLRARAFDCVMANHDPAQFEALARKAGFTGFGYYPAQGFMHIDTGPARVWGEPFPAATVDQGHMAKAPVSTRFTEKAAAIGAAGTASTGAIAAVSGLSDTAQLLVVAVVVVVVFGLAWVTRKKVAAYFDAG